jgi:dGTPase
VVSESRRRLEIARPKSADDVRRYGGPLIAFAEDVAKAEADIKAFLKQHMYRHARVMRIMGEAERIVCDLFEHYQSTPKELPPEWLDGAEGESDAARARRIGNFIAGMTDRFALIEHQRLFDSTSDLR